MSCARASGEGGATPGRLLAPGRFVLTSFGFPNLRRAGTSLPGGTASASCSAAASCPDFSRSTADRPVRGGFGAKPARRSASTTTPSGPPGSSFRPSRRFLPLSIQSAPDSMTSAAGTRLGPYEILTPLGAGGIGGGLPGQGPETRERSRGQGPPEDFLEGEERRERFEREAKLLAALNHPNIAAVFEEIGTPTAPVLVMELLEGETLRASLAGGKLSTRKALDFARQIAGGLAAAHEKGIVHRDLKPENIFVTKDGRVKILDFGLAKLAQPDGAGNVTNLPTATQGTAAGVVMGTLGYMSPEQVKGLPTDARSDIFSFGAVLYEMLTGSRAFKGDSAAETISAILREDPPDISTTNQSLPSGPRTRGAPLPREEPGAAFPLRARPRVRSRVAVGAGRIAASSVAAAEGRTPTDGRGGALVLLASRRSRVRRGASSETPGRPPPSFHRLTFRRGRSRRRDSLRTVRRSSFGGLGGKPDRGRPGPHREPGVASARPRARRLSGSRRLARSP